MAVTIEIARQLDHFLLIRVNTFWSYSKFDSMVILRKIINEIAKGL